MNHNQIAEICRGVLLDNIYCGSIPQDPWDRLIYEFAEKHNSGDLSNMEVAQKFTDEVLTPTMAEILKS